MDRLPGKTPEEQNRFLQQFFHEVFSSEKGRVVFNVILNDLRFFSVCRSDEDAALRNYAAVLINERMGIRDTVAVSDFLIDCKVKELGDNGTD